MLVILQWSLLLCVCKGGHYAYNLHDKTPSNIWKTVLYQTPLLLSTLCLTSSQSFHISLIPSFYQFQEKDLPAFTFLFTSSRSLRMRKCLMLLDIRVEVEGNGVWRHFISCNANKVTIAHLFGSEMA